MQLPNKSKEELKGLLEENKEKSIRELKKERKVNKKLNKHHKDFKLHKELNFLIRAKQAILAKEYPLVNTITREFREKIKKFVTFKTLQQKLQNLNEDKRLLDTGNLKTG